MRCKIVNGRNSSAKIESERKVSVQITKLALVILGTKLITKLDSSTFHSNFMRYHAVLLKNIGYGGRNKHAPW